VFFYLAKVLWFFAQPSSLMAVAVIAGALLMHSGRHGLGRRLLAGGVVALLIGGLSPLGDWLTWPLESRFPRADLERGAPAGIIVLGGAQDGNATPPRELAGLNEAAERFTEAVALARRFPQARVVFAGGSGNLIAAGPTEAALAARLFEGLGVPRARITLEDRSRDTYENAVFTKRLVAPTAGERWLLITSSWHMPRAMGCFRQAGFAVEAWPVDYRTSGRFELWLNPAIPDGLRRIDWVMREYVGLVMYYLAGRTDALFPAP
jgi:uncharacterized SAM-binding protein YcdF (DUF218 family)